jgi:hypothetical protein
VRQGHESPFIERIIYRKYNMRKSYSFSLMSSNLAQCTSVIVKLVQFQKASRKAMRECDTPA